MNPTKTNTPTKTELSQLCNQTKTRNREKFDFRPILNGAAYFRRHLLENDETVILDIFTWPVIYRQRRHLATARTMAAVITEPLNWNQGDDVRITTQIMEIMQIGMVVIPMPQTTLGMREQQCRLIVIISVKHLSVDAPQ